MSVAHATEGLSVSEYLEAEEGSAVRHYLSIPSLREYVLVEQDEPHVTVYRNPDASRSEVAQDLESAIELSAVQLTLGLDTVYADLPEPD